VSAPFSDECECAGVIQLRTQIEESRRLMTLALDFWAAPGIDMPDIDTFNDMVVFLEETGEPWVPKGEPYKPVGMTTEEHDRRELIQAISKRDGEAIYRFAMERSAEIKKKALDGTGPGPEDP